MKGLLLVLVIMVVILVAVSAESAPQRAVLIDSNEQAVGTSTNPLKVSFSGDQTIDGTITADSIITTNAGGSITGDPDGVADSGDELEINFVDVENAMLLTRSGEFAISITDDVQTSHTLTVGSDGNLYINGVAKTS